MSDDIQYIPANAIGYKELSKQEVEIIRTAIDSTEDTGKTSLLSAAIAAAILQAAADTPVLVYPFP